MISTSSDAGVVGQAAGRVVDAQVERAGASRSLSVVSRPTTIGFSSPLGPFGPASSARTAASRIPSGGRDSSGSSRRPARTHHGRGSWATWYRPLARRRYVLPASSCTPLDCQPRSAATVARALSAASGLPRRELDVHPLEIVAVVEIGHEQLPIFVQARPIVGKDCASLARQSLARRPAECSWRKRAGSADGRPETPPPPSTSRTARFPDARDCRRQRSSPGSSRGARRSRFARFRCGPTWTLRRGSAESTLSVSLPSSRRCVASSSAMPSAYQGGPDAADQRSHEGVRPFVQQQVAAIVGARLVVATTAGRRGRSRS